jgi:hypothetical protein
VARRSVVMTEKPEDMGVRSLYARMWGLVFIWGDALFVLIGASMLYSFVHEVDWRVCATLCVILLYQVTEELLVEAHEVPETAAIKYNLLGVFALAGDRFARLSVLPV